MSIRRLSIVLWLTVSLPSALIAQWEQTAGPSGGFLLSLTILQPASNEPATLLAGNSSRLYTSTNFGKSWLLADSGGTLNAPHYLDCVGGTLFAFRSITTLRSTNRGQTWEDISSDLHRNQVIALAATNDSESILLAATDGYFVHRSSDRGDHWTLVNSGLTSSNASSIVIASNAARDAFVGTTDGVFHSSNLGDTWVRLENLQTQTRYPILSLVPDVSADGGIRLYVGDAAGVLHHSTDLGRTWSRQTVGSPATSLRAVRVVSTTNSDTLYLNSSEGIFRSHDGAASWQPSNQGIQDLDVTRILTCEGWAFALTRSDIYASTDNGAHWSASSAGMFHPLCVTNALLALPAEGPFPDVLLSAGRTTGISSTTDYGDTWVKHNNGHIGEEVVSLHSSTISIPPHPRYIWAGSMNGVLRSEDRGSDWERTSTGMGNRRVQALHMKPRNDGLGDYLYAGLYGDQAFRSGNYGDNWHDLGYTNLSLHGAKSFATIRDTLYASANKLLRSLDDGETWSEIHAGLSPLVTLSTEGRTYLIGGGGNGVDISTDGGVTWKHAQMTSRPNAFVFSLIVVEREGSPLLVAGTQGEGVFVSDDLGETWTNISTGLHDPIVNSLAVVGPYLFAGTRDWGVWRRPLSQITGVEARAAGMPPVPTLLQNYPNPFHDQTAVQFHIPARSFVSLCIYDVVGRKVANLVNADLNAGIHVAQWNAAGRTNGLYLCRLTVNSTVLSKKLTLMK